ncbi:hypothetical protein [Kibdelosporangium aridum]|uniref:hypothetical protein n=1 Tax=Kibdelosporangium aridum TaxID=2030 RepID=UPI000ACB9A65|nr:hypothetical protein [Kibdelosporangium aridum]
MEGLDIWHHSLHLGLWYWRPTLWWKPAAGVDAESVEWLREKYPNWETVYGDKWRVLAEAVNAGDMARTLPETLPWLCNTCHLPCCNATYGRDGKWRVRNNSLKHNESARCECEIRRNGSADRKANLDSDRPITKSVDEITGTYRTTQDTG